MINIDIILPYKELFAPNGASAVSISVKNSIQNSEYKKTTRVFGQYVENSFDDINFTGFRTKKLLHFGNNLSIFKQYLNQINLNKSNRIIEIHNRPYLFHYLLNKKNNQCVVLYFHNDPLSMKGSKTKNERLAILSKASGIVFVSKYLRDKFFTDINESFDRTFIIPNSLDRNQEAIIEKKQKIVLFVGRIVEEKGVDLYVDAIKELSGEFSDWSFLVIGSSKLGYDKKSSYEKEIIQSLKKLDNNVEFQGYVPNEKVKDLMSKSSILVVPSIWQEPFGMTAIEGLSNKMLVVGSEVGGLSEIIKDKGVLIKDIDSRKLTTKLRELLNSSVEIKKYQNLTWDNYSFDQKNISSLQDNMRREIFTKFNNSSE